MNSMLLVKKNQMLKNYFTALALVISPISQPIFAVAVEDQPEHYSNVQHKVDFCLSKIGNSNPYVLAEIVKKSNLDLRPEITIKSHKYIEECNLNLLSNKHEKPMHLIDDDRVINTDTKRLVRNWITNNKKGLFDALSSNYFYDIQDQINLILSDLRDLNIGILKEIANLTFSVEILTLSESSYNFLKANDMLKSFSLFETQDHLQDAKLYFIKNNRELDPCIKKFVKNWFKYNREDVELSFLIYGIFLLE